MTNPQLADILQQKYKTKDTLEWIAQYFSDTMLINFSVKLLSQMLLNNPFYIPDSLK